MQYVRLTLAKSLSVGKRVGSLWGRKTGRESLIRSAANNPEHKTRLQREIEASERRIAKPAYESAIHANARTLTLPGESDAHEFFAQIREALPHARGYTSQPPALSQPDRQQSSEPRQLSVARILHARWTQKLQLGVRDQVL